MCWCNPSIRTPSCGPLCHKGYGPAPEKEPPSPNYPRKLEGDLVMRRVPSGAQGGYSYAAHLTDGFESAIVLGPYRDTEAEALLALSVSVSQRAESLRKRSSEIVDLAEGKTSRGIEIPGPDPDRFLVGR